MLMHFVKKINYAPVPKWIGLELGLKSLMLFAVLPSSLWVMVCEEERPLGSLVWKVRQRPVTQVTTEKLFVNQACLTHLERDSRGVNCFK